MIDRLFGELRDRIYKRTGIAMTLLSDKLFSEYGGYSLDIEARISNFTLFALQAKWNDPQERYVGLSVLGLHFGQWERLPFVFSSDWKKKKSWDEGEWRDQLAMNRQSINFNARICSFTLLRFMIRWYAPEEEFHIALLGQHFSLEPFFNRWQERMVERGWGMWTEDKQRISLKSSLCGKCRKPHDKRDGQN